MSAKNVQIEVLLMTGTAFSSAQLCNKEDITNKDHLTEKEQLGEACWNGLIETILPEIYLQPAGKGILYLWEIKEAGSFLEIELGEFPAPIDRRYSITPHSFFSSLLYN
jgi:hypothetical protein